MQQINPLKKINLEQYQKPKTLIVVHYKGKRISVPLLGQCKNLTQMLYHHIDKFQQTVLKNDQKWQINSQKKIVCFCSSSNTNQKNHKQNISVKKNIQKYLKYTDGDLKIDLLLSLIRIQDVQSRPTLDVTKYYKYMQIQPYYIQYPTFNNLTEKEHPLTNKYYFYRLIQRNCLKNVYLARSLQNGYFYSIKIYRTRLHMAQHQARFLNAINNQMQQKFPAYMKNQYFSQKSLQKQNSVVPRTQIHMIPSQEQQDQQDDDMNPRYKHLAIVSKYNIKGKLFDRINDKNSKLNENDLLKYLKQLVWITYTLHQDYNIVHRNLTPQSFQIDELGDLKLTTFSSWVECYDQEGRLLSYPIQGDSSRSDFSHQSRIYEEQFQAVSNGWYHIGHYTPPQVSKKAKQGYNKFVDYFTIGIVIKEIYQKVYEYQNRTQNSTKSKLIQKMIANLTSQNLKQRQEIALQIVQGIKKTKLQQTQRKYKQISFSLSQIRLGQFINFDISATCVQNQDNDLDFNGISHQEIINFFKPTKQFKQSVYQQNGSQYQAKKQISKQKKRISNIVKISKGQNTNISHSRDKSVKSMKSNKSKDKSRTKNKLLNEKTDKMQTKSKSKSHKKLISPQRNSFNTNIAISAGNSKIMKVNINSTSENTQKKSKSKSCNKLKNQRSPQKKIKQSKQKKQKIYTQTLSNGIHQNHEHTKVMNRTGTHLVGVNIPLPKHKYKSPAKNA